MISIQEAYHQQPAGAQPEFPAAAVTVAQQDSDTGQHVQLNFRKKRGAKTMLTASPDKSNEREFMQHHRILVPQ